MCKSRYVLAVGGVAALCGVAVWAWQGYESRHDQEVIRWAEKNGMAIDNWQAGQINWDLDQEGWVAEGRAMPYAEDVLRKLLAKDDPRIEAVLVVRGLGAVGTQKSTPLLVEQTKNDWSVVRSEAIYALRQIGDPKCVPALVDRLLCDDDSNVCWAAAGALAKIGDPRGIPAMEEAIESLGEEQERPAGEQTPIEDALTQLRQKLQSKKARGDL